MPLPSTPLRLAPSRSNGTNSRPACSARMPGPVSATLSRSRVAVTAHRTGRPFTRADRGCRRGVRSSGPDPATTPGGGFDAGDVQHLVDELEEEAVPAFEDLVDRISLLGAESEPGDEPSERPPRGSGRGHQHEPLLDTNGERATVERAGEGVVWRRGDHETARRRARRAVEGDLELPEGRTGRPGSGWVGCTVS